MASFLRRPAMCALVFLVIAGSCANPPSPSLAVSEGPRFELNLKPGPFYETSTTWFLFRIPVYPQVAVWAESPDGQFIATIYATDKTARGSFIDAPANGRPEALPVWSHRRTDGADAVTGPTPRGDTGVAAAWAGREPGPVRIYLETNRSYDWNAWHTQANGGVSGQPSVVYMAVLDTSAGSARAAFTPIGTGSPDGSDGDIHAGLGEVDTALELFSVLEISWKE